MVKLIAAISILVLAIPACVFFYRNALDRSKSNKTSLFGSFNSEYREDNLFKVSSGTLEGLDEAEKRKKETKDIKEDKA